MIAPRAPVLQSTSSVVAVVAGKRRRWSHVVPSDGPNGNTLVIPYSTQGSIIPAEARRALKHRTPPRVRLGASRLRMLAAARSFLPQVSKQLVSLSFRRSGFTVAAGAPRAPKTSPSGFLTGSIAGADPVSCGGFRGAACVVKNPAAALSAPRATRGITMAFDEEGPLVALYNKCASVLPEHPRNGTTEERDLAKAIAPFLGELPPVPATSCCIFANIGRVIYLRRRFLLSHTETFV